MNSEKKLKFAQIVTITGEQYTFSEPTIARYDGDSEWFVISVGEDDTIFPRECVVAFRVVPDTEVNNNDEETEIIDMFGRRIDDDE